MGLLAARQKPKLRQLNYFTDKTELEAPGPRRPGKEEGAKNERKERRNNQLMLKKGVKNQ